MTNYVPVVRFESKLPKYRRTVLISWDGVFVHPKTIRMSEAELFMMVLMYPDSLITHVKYEYVNLYDVMKVRPKQANDIYAVTLSVANHPTVDVVWDKSYR